jgi:hypothetical protein
LRQLTPLLCVPACTPRLCKLHIAIASCCASIACGCCALAADGRCVRVHETRPKTVPRRLRCSVTLTLTLTLTLTYHTPLHRR